MKALFHLAFVLSVFVSQGRTSSRPDSKVYKLVYKDFYKTDFGYCIRMFNETHEIGCQSSQSGNVGILHQVKDQFALDEFISSVKSEDYAVFVEEKIFNKASLLKLLGTGRVSGILVYAETEGGQERSFDWSPELECPIYQPGLYNEDYGKDYQSCSEGSKILNPIGDGMLDISVPIPVFYIGKPHVKEELLNCMNKHNGDNKYPYCGVEMLSFMNGAVNSKLCVRRTILDSYLSGSSFCALIRGHNVVGSLKNLKNKKRYKTVLVTSPLDARSFMVYSTAASNAGTATGLLTTLAVASILGRLTTAEKKGLEKNIVFAIVDGEAFDGIGGKKMVKDLKSGDFPVEGGESKDKAVIEMADIANIVELRELGLMQSNLYAHYDPVLYASKTAQIDLMVDKLKANSPTSTTVTVQTTDMGIPPSTIQTVLRSGSKIPSLLLTEYDSQYINRHHMSRQDNLRYLLGRNFSSNASEKEMLVKIQPLADKLGQVAETVAKSVYEMAATTSDPLVIARIKSNKNEIASLIANLIYCFLHNSNCSYFTNFLPSSFVLQLPKNEPLLRFISVTFNTQSSQVAIVQGLLHGFLGEAVKKSADTCEGGTGLTGRGLFYKNNPQSLKMKKKVCLWASVFSTPATQADDGSMWTESSWDKTDSIKLRMFVMQSDYSQSMILISGVIYFTLSSLIIFVLNRNASILFPNSSVV